MQAVLATNGSRQMASSEPFTNSSKSARKRRPDTDVLVILRAVEEGSNFIGNEHATWSLGENVFRVRSIPTI